MRAIRISDYDAEQQTLEHLIAAAEAQMDVSAIQMAREVAEARARALVPFIQLAETQIDSQVLQYNAALLKKFRTVFNLEVGPITSGVFNNRPSSSIERAVLGDECLAWLRLNRIKRCVFFEEFNGRYQTIDSILVAKGIYAGRPQKYGNTIRCVAFIGFAREDRAALFKMMWADQIIERLSD